MTTTRFRSIFVRLTVTSIAAAFGLTLSACGSSDTSASSDAPSTNKSATGKSDKSAQDVKIPEGFPDDIPLPEDATLKSATVLGAGKGWRLMYVVDPDDDGRLAKYSGRLKAAGFDIEEREPTSVNISAARSNWNVDAVVRPPVITVQVLSVN